MSAIFRKMVDATGAKSGCGSMGRRDLFTWLRIRAYGPLLFHANPTPYLHGVLILSVAQKIESPLPALRWNVDESWREASKAILASIRATLDPSVQKEAARSLISTQGFLPC